jgi:predicted dehydrogenase
MSDRTSPRAPVRAASVGLGWWSDELAKSVEGSSDKLRITACTSRSREKREAFHARFGSRPVESYEQVLADPDIDAVLLTTPHSLHGEHVRQAAGAGKHVFVEKPFVLEAEDGVRAAEACRAAGVVLAVGHNRRFLSAAQWLKELVRDGALGTILHIEANFSSPGALSYTEDRWRANRKESPGGAIAGLGIHMIDLMCWLLGPVERINAQAIRRAVSVEMDDTTSALFKFETGPTGYFGTLFACPYTTFVTVYGTKGNAHIDPDANTGWLRPAGGTVAHQAFEAVDTLRLELEEFAAACLSQGSFRVTASEAIHNVAIMQAIVASAATDGQAHDPRSFAAG